MVSSGNNGKQGFVEEFEGEMPEEKPMEPTGRRRNWRDARSPYC